MPATKPRLFIGSSSENLKIAYAIQENLDHDFEATVWNQNVFDLSRSTLETLVAKVPDFDAAVFVFSPDDVASVRGKAKQIVRDNVVFELGLFIGQLAANAHSSWCPEAPTVYICRPICLELRLLRTRRSGPIGIGTQRLVQRVIRSGKHSTQLDHDRSSRMQQHVFLPTKKS